MRQFIVLGHDVPLEPTFSLSGLPSEAGRLDVLCRCVTAAFLLSHGIREDVRVHLVLQDELTIQFDGAHLRNLNPDERSTAARVRDALDAKDEAIGHVPADVSPGVSISRLDFEATLSAAADESTVLQLHADGDPVTDRSPPSDPLFVLSDHRDFTDREATLIEEYADDRINLSPERLHAEQATTIAHNYLDTAGYEQY